MKPYLRVSDLVLELGISRTLAYDIAKRCGCYKIGAVVFFGKRNLNNPGRF